MTLHILICCQYCFSDVHGRLWSEDTMTQGCDCTPASPGALTSIEGYKKYINFGYSLIIQKRVQMLSFNILFSNLDNINLAHIIPSNQDIFIE